MGKGEVCKSCLQEYPERDPWHYRYEWKRGLFEPIHNECPPKETSSLISFETQEVLGRSPLSYSRRDILEDLRKSGFPLEIQVGSQFSNRGWTVRHQAISRVESDPKPRYIDILATKLIEGKFGGFNRLNFTIVCECKKSEKMPWMFYSPPADLLVKEVAAVTILKTLSQPPLGLKDMPRFAKSHFLTRDPSARFAQASHLAFWKDNAKENGFNQINGAINQVVNATESHIRRLKETIKLVSGIVMVVCPLIVLDGALFDYDLAADGRPNLKPATYVKYLAATITPETKLELDNRSVTTSFTEDWLIDIVTKDALPEYIGWLEEDMRLIMGDS